MGSKGSNTTTTQQQQTYNPTGAPQIQSALQQGQAAAQLPFNIPQAPVAGFSQDQQNAFQNVNNAQGMAQPYINQAQQDFSPQGAQNFLNPYASNVMAQMQNIFGQQQQQATGQLTQAAGGVGADRIAVGQGELANQQGLAAGQTMSGLYNNAVQQAQGAGYGTAALGSQAQNAALQGAQAQLGTGGLQQQLSQAQMNSPYQLQLAKAAFPYQQAQFNAGITGALAPGLGGTTSGTGSTTGPSPSMLSQILGLGTAGVGAAGSMGAFNSDSGMNPKGSSPSYGGGNMWSGDAYGGSASNPAAGLSAGDYGASGGRVAYAEGGAAENPYNLPSGFNDKPINVDTESIVPKEALTPIRPNIPQLNLNPPAASGGGGGGSAVGDVAKIAQMAMMFAKRGGRIGYAAGGAPDDDSSPATFDERFPYRMADQGAVDDWRNGTPATPMAYSGDAGAQAAFPPPADAHGRSGSAPAAFAAPPAAQDVSAPSTPAAAAPEATSKHDRFIDSPWAALMAAGLGIAGGTSPFAGVNIGQGGLQGLKTLQTQRETSQKDETIDQAAKRLELEAEHHKDQYTKSTPYQQYEMKKPVPMGQTIGPLGLPMTTYGVPDGKGGFTPVQAPTPTTQQEADNPVKNIVDGIKSGKLPPDTTGLYRLAPGVKSQLAKDGFDLTHAQLEMAAAKKQIQALDGPQMVRYVGLANGVDKTIDRVRELSVQMKQGGIPLLNQLELKKFIQVEGNSPRGQLATAYNTQVGILKEEFANLANGGYAPTEPAWKLANEQINGNYGVLQLGASLDEVQRAIRYRLHNIPNMDTLGPGSPNRYVPGGQQGAAPAGGPAPAGAAAPATPGAPQIGEIRTNPHGVKGRWNGTGWEVIQ
jgi:hypothetical protein